MMMREKLFLDKKLLEKQLFWIEITYTYMNKYNEL